MSETKKCVVCREEKPQGIFILQTFICEACEQEMVNTDVIDERYSFFVERMRKIWKMEA